MDLSLQTGKNVLLYCYLHLYIDKALEFQQFVDDIDFMNLHLYIAKALVSAVCR